jgi:FkbM family methyltransferase
MGLIFDIGANMGAFAKAWRKANEYTQVVCVEANPELIAPLEGLFYGDNNVTILNKLVSQRSGEKKDFYINKNHVLSTASTGWMEQSRFCDTYSDCRTVQVETITLDDLVAKYGEPAYIKIDVEGFEYDVLKGLNTRVGQISFEFVEERITEVIKCCKHLINIGYTHFGYCFRDDYLEFPKVYTAFHEMDIMHKINVTGQSSWGNIYVK